jgi:hypothetical protein
MKIEGIIQFENPLPVSDECMSKEFPIIIGDQAGTFATPQHIEEFYTKAPAPLSWEDLVKPKKSSNKLSAKINWGSCIEWPTGTSILNTCSIWFEVANNEEEEIGKKIFDSLESWRNLFIDNISITSQLSLRGLQTVKTIHMNGAGLYNLFIEDSDKRFRDKSDQITNIIVGKNRTISSENFKKALDATSQFNEPSLEYYYLLDSKEALDQGNYRKSILDSATAVELCLNNVLKAKLLVDMALKNTILKNYNSISKKRELLNVIGVQLPNYDYQKEFEEIRNKAIHAGHLPNANQAEKAYSIARDVLETFKIK